MTNTVRMVSKTTFANDRIRVFRHGGPEEGETGVPVITGDTFETDPSHARELSALGHAALVSGSVDDLPDAPLEPHHQVSVDALRADRARRAAGDSADAVEVQTDREPSAVTTQRSARRAAGVETGK